MGDQWLIVLQRWKFRLTGLRKKGYVIERIGGEEKGPSSYWVVPATKAAA
jgi:hypothetical protein